MIIYWDGSDAAKASVAYCQWLRGNRAYEVHLLILKAKINALGMKNTPRSKMDGAVLATRLMLRVVEAWQDTEPIKKAVIIGHSNAVLGARLQKLCAIQ